MGLRQLFYRAKVKLTQNIKYDEAFKAVERKLSAIEIQRPGVFLTRNGSDSDNFNLRRQKYGNTVKVAVEVGGGLGDYIVALPILDNIIAYGKCVIDLYTCNNVMFPEKMYGARPNLSIHSYMTSDFRFEDYDYALRIDHFIMRKHCDCFRYVSKLMPDFLKNVYHIESFNLSHYSDTTREPYRNAATLKQAKFSGLNRWTYLSPANDIFGMKEQRAGIMIKEVLYKKFAKQTLSSQKYIVLSRGADPASGGTNRLNSLPAEAGRFELRLKSRFRLKPVAMRLKPAEATAHRRPRRTRHHEVYPGVQCTP